MHRAALVAVLWNLHGELFMSDTSFESQPLLDEEALNELKDMLEEALAEIVDSFLAGLDAEVAAIDQAFSEGHMAVRAAAHSLKGSAGNLGARRLAALASTIEKTALAGDVGTCQTLMPALRTLADASRQGLTAYMARP